MNSKRLLLQVRKFFLLLSENFISPNFWEQNERHERFIVSHHDFFVFLISLYFLTSSFYGLEWSWESNYLSTSGCMKMALLFSKMFQDDSGNAILSKSRRKHSI